MSPAAATIEVDLGFTPASHVIDDPDRPGLLRSGLRTGSPYDGEGVEVHRCQATDLSERDDVQPDLFGFGFAMADLSGLDTLQRTLGAVREAGSIGDDQAATIRRELAGAVLPCSDGTIAKVLHIADEGLIMRSAGPARLSVVGPRSAGMNDHGPARSIHADQDVYGTPLVQLMEGRAPELLRHDSPDGSNDASLMLANLWIPLQQITQPLVLADGRTVDRRRHQLRYGLATDEFLDREDEMAINDIWTFLPDPGQQWYLHSALDHRCAYLFNTLSTPHGSCSLPGEEEAARLYLALAEAEDALEQGEAGPFADLLRRAVDGSSPVPPSTPPALLAAVGEMGDVARAGLVDTEASRAIPAGGRVEDWSERSRSARRRVVRMSIELRLVVSLDR